VKLARILAARLAVNSVAFGANYLTRPASAGPSWIGRAARTPGAQVMARSQGARDAALGLGALRALLRGRDDEARAWMAAHALADGADVVATWVVRDRLPKRGAHVALGIAADRDRAAGRGRGRAGPPERLESARRVAGRAVRRRSAGDLPPGPRRRRDLRRRARPPRRRFALTRRSLQSSMTRSRLTIQIEEDRAVLAALVKRLGVPADRLKSALAWAGEKAGRLKRNGRFVTYSPLSRVLELEGLIAGVNGKHALWSVLRDRAEHDDRLDRAECERLISRAEHQLAELRRRHRAAAALAFSA
jgi:hypothetical protein